jgi:hypothetical protein
MILPASEIIQRCIYIVSTTGLIITIIPCAVAIQIILRFGVGVSGTGGLLFWTTHPEVTRDATSETIIRRHFINPLFI